MLLVLYAFVCLFLTLSVSLCLLSIGFEIDLAGLFVWYDD